MFENIVIFLLFIGACWYVGTLIVKQFSKKDVSCAKGCGGNCSSISTPKEPLIFDKNGTN
jgi:hypothetical protein